MVRALAALALAAGCATPPAGDDGDDGPRIVTIGGAVTEIAFALGAGDDVVGVDSSSTYPPAAAALPRVGSHHAVSTEAVLALRPTLVLARRGTAPSTLAQLGDAGVEVATFDDVTDRAGIGRRIDAVARALGREPAGARLVRQTDAALDQAASRIARHAGARPPRVLFVYARGANALQTSGRGTAADTIIELAGGVNAIADVRGFRPVSGEAIVAAQPDVLLMMASGADSLAEHGGVFSIPGVAQTPAGRDRRVVTMDGLYLLGLGPRAPDAALELHRAITP